VVIAAILCREYASVSLFPAIVAHERVFRTFVMGSTLTFTVRLTFNETAT
jgi:hypothetical protein